jgi:hypothetical protein
LASHLQPIDPMKATYRHALIACLAAAAAALALSLALAGFHVAGAVYRTLEFFTADRAEPVPAPDLAAALLALGAALLVAGAVALAVAGRRAALALERISLIEQL